MNHFVMGNCNTKRKFLMICAIARSSIIAVICLFAIAACSSEIDTPVSEEESVRSYLYITLVMPQMTRATDKDTEPGLDVENQISNLTVFFFNDATQGVSGEAKTEFFKKVYVDRGFKRTNNGVEVEVPLSDYTPVNSDKLLGSRIAVVANMGDLCSLSTRGELQQYIPEKTWQEGDTPSSPSGCSKFTMASAKNDDGFITKAPEAEQPKNGDVYYKASVTVERTAARIDLCYNPLQEHAPSQEDEEGYIEYTSGDNGYVRLYGLSPINAMQQPSYALKRISEGPSENYTCFDTYHYTGDLPEAGTPSRPTAYVIEPHTAGKTADATPPADWYGSTSATILSKSQWENGKNLAALLGDKDIKLELDNGQRRSLIVTYTNENTQHYTQHSEKWLTGLQLRAVFVPTTVYTDGNATTKKEDYKPGETFWCCRYKEHNANELYFANREAAEAYLKAHPATSAKILEFPSGRCFYHTWIRHTVEERDPAIIFPMEYGIVRNHIYRVSFTFHRAGNPTPDIENPQNVEAVIYVRPWHVFKHEQIIL